MNIKIWPWASKRRYELSSSGSIPSTIDFNHMCFLPWTFFDFLSDCKRKKRKLYYLCNRFFYSHTPSPHVVIPSNWSQGIRSHTQTLPTTWTTLLRLKYFVYFSFLWYTRLSQISQKEKAIHSFASTHNRHCVNI